MTFVAGTGVSDLVTLVNAEPQFTLFGYDQGVMGGLLTLPAFEAQFPQTAGGFAGSTSATLQSLLVAICERRNAGEMLSRRRTRLHGWGVVESIRRR